ncbi:TonB-dependent receptor [Kordiimonas sp. SCSIO 12610]|uniref:TonB-dependent receptor n=1 Tax=Kordiimonas sp. SCSIO 12610 TaxID=2829597 RepID=UPI00210D38F0|nr:TonB-dependent receptor [Kordiimonas sp. SCSIO 12610]UTW54605.1 TonB-dependent receptor [Kordiimonas sp. SCSIO 12610]
MIRRPLVFACFVLVVSRVALAQGHTAGTLYDFKIKRLPLGKALFEFAKQTGVSISQPNLSYRDGKARSLRGEYTLEAALEHMLRNSGFTFEILGGRSVKVLRKPPDVSIPEPVAPVLVPILKPVIEEIVVTSLYRADTGQNLPYSISVATLNDTVGLQSEQTSNVARQIASFNAVESVNGQSKLVIRGLTDGSFTGRAQSLVGTYFDGAQLSFNAPEPGLRLIDVDRIEVLRGPQGTLYGSGALTGIYNVVPNQPDTSASEATVRAGFAMTEGGGFSQNYSAIINLPLVDDRLAVRASAYYEDLAGFIDDQRLQLENVNVQEAYGGRLALLYQVNDNWSLTLGGNFQDKVRQDSSYFRETLGDLVRDNFLQEPSEDRFEQLYLNLKGDFGWGKLTSSTSYIERTISRTLDASFNVPAIIGLSSRASPFAEVRSIRTFSHETHLVNASGSRLEWLAGAYFARRQEDILSTLTVPGAAELPQISSDEIFSEALSETQLEYSLFGEATYYVTEKLALTGGVRGFHYDTDAVSRVIDLVLPRDDTVFGEQTQTGATPKFVVAYHWDHTTLTYAQFSEGYRLGGINFIGFTPFPIPGGDGGQNLLGNFASDRLSNFELGIKTQAFNRKLTLNVAAFASLWRNIQALEFDPFGFALVETIGDARIFGFDADLVIRPLANMQIKANIGFAQSEITDTTSSFGALLGERLPGAPQFTAGTVFSYDFALQNSVPATVNIDYSFIGSSDILFDQQLSPQTDESHLVNAQMSVFLGGYHISLYVDNLFDTRANVFAFGNPFSSAVTGDQITVPRPRTYGVNVSFSF